MSNNNVKQESQKIYLLAFIDPDDCDTDLPAMAFSSKEKVFEYIKQMSIQEDHDFIENVDYEIIDAPVDPKYK